MSHEPFEVTARLKAEAQRLGFDRAAVCDAVTPEGFARLSEWLEAGYAGEMHYLSDRLPAYEHPRHVLDGARSLVMLATVYRTAEPQPIPAGRGRVSRYAWGSDYHEVLHERLVSLAAWLKAVIPGAKVRGVVDTAPLLEREFAQLAGLGWIGKHTLLLSRELGSWFFLAALLTDQPLVPDEPFFADHCGSCRACLDACPTQAFVAPYLLDARRCISYLTIEHRGPIDDALRPALGEWLFGCDICQEVCPWNQRTPLADEPRFAPRTGENGLDLRELLALDEEAFRQRFRGTPLWRAKRRGLLRNAAIALGNAGDPRDVPALCQALQDAEPLIREAAAWALGRLGGAEAQLALQNRAQQENNELVRASIGRALREVESS